VFEVKEEISVECPWLRQAPKVRITGDGFLLEERSPNEVFTLGSAGAFTKSPTGRASVQTFLNGEPINVERRRNPF